MRVASINCMALPPNKHIMATLESAPGATVLMVQECDIFHDEIKHLPGYTTALVPAGRNYSCFVLFKPSVWEHVSTHFPKAYDGAHGISLTRHIAVTVLRHKRFGWTIGFISYHAVTWGTDRRRKHMRAEGDAAVRKAVSALRRQGIPAIVGCDQNRTNKVFATAKRLYHRIDSLYSWSAGKMTLKPVSSSHRNTSSDHDTLIGTYAVSSK